MTTRIPTQDAVAELSAANYYVEQDTTYVYVRKAINALPDRLLILRNTVSRQRVEQFTRRPNDPA